MSVVQLWASLARLQRKNRLPLVVLVCGGWLLLARLTSEMPETETQAFDELVLLGLRSKGDLSVPLGPSWLLNAVRDVNSLGGLTVLAIITILATLYMMVARQRIAAAFLLFSVLGGEAISSILKLGVARPRPTIVPHLQNVYDLSYPSGHAMMSAVTYLTIAAILATIEKDRRRQIFLFASAIFLTITIGLCRLYLGVHYPSDVIAGWCAGSTWVLCCWLGAGRRLGIPARVTDRDRE